MSNFKQIQVRRDVSSDWTAINPILALGEPGLETDTLKLKFGDGVTAWNDLEYLTQGIKGDKGDRGYQGTAGLKGDPGNDGAPGATGQTGLPGSTGAPGATGATGAQGAKGDTGDRGLKGDKGDTGDIGATGATGAQGIQGIQGVKGDKGDTGDPGEGLPTGGTTGQQLVKLSNTDFDYDWETPAGAGDMLASVYDPQNIADDAFDQDNMTNGTTNKNYTATEKTKLAGIETAADVTDAVNVGAAGAFMKSVDDTDDITIGTTNKFATAAEKTKLGHITVTQAVDLDAIETNANNVPGIKTKTDFITVTQAVDLDAIETNANNVPGIKTKTDFITVTQAVDLDTMESDIAAKQPLDSDLTTIAALDSSVAGALVTDGSGWIKKTYAQLKTALGLVKADVGLGNVDNTADSAKTFTESQITGLVSDLAGKQPLDSDLTTIAGLTATTDNFMVANASAWASRTPAQAKTSLALVKGDVGLGSVDNTADSAKSVASAAVLTTARNIAGVSFNGSANIAIPSTGLSDTANLVRVVKQQVFTADGTYTPSTGMLYCVVEAVGGGGAGGGTAGAAGEMRCASGGGAGGYSMKTFSAATIGASKAVDIGAGGTAGSAGDNAGNAGADTTLGTTLLVAKGGSGGAARGVTTVGGAGGVAGTGDVAIVGQKGYVGMFNGASTLFAVSGGAGGSSVFGGGGSGAAHISTQTGAAGVNGSGGQGGSVYNGTGTVAGGAGGNGLMVITEYCSQ